LVDFAFIFCVYAKYFELRKSCTPIMFYIQPFLAGLPFFFRFLQCLRRYRDTKQRFTHLGNALKYLTSILVTMWSTLDKIYQDPNDNGITHGFTIFGYIWIVFAAFSSLYGSFWDLRMDWGLLDFKSPNWMLRKEICYSRWVYYVAMGVNIVLRISWVMLISPKFFSITANKDVILFAVSCAEVLRRGIWNLIRMENEHMNNCGKYRASKQIPELKIPHHWFKKTH